MISNAARAAVRLVTRWGTLAALVAGCTASATVGPASPASTPVTAAAARPASERPATEDACRSCNGLWGVHGLSQTPSCNCRTTDGGKRCRDGAECQGLCIAGDEPERETVEAGPPARGYFVGKCSETVTVFGCMRLIDRGALSHGPVPLAEPPAQLCID
jgi:hypothetical protein